MCKVCKWGGHNSTTLISFDWFVISFGVIVSGFLWGFFHPFSVWSEILAAIYLPQQASKPARTCIMMALCFFFVLVVQFLLTWHCIACTQGDHHQSLVIIIILHASTNSSMQTYACDILLSFHVQLAGIGYHKLKNVGYSSYLFGPICYACLRAFIQLVETRGSKSTHTIGSC